MWWEMFRPSVTKQNPVAIIYQCSKYVESNNFLKPSKILQYAPEMFQIIKKQ